MVCFLLPQDKGGAFYSLVGGGGVPSTVRVCGTLNLDHVLGAQNHTHLNQHLQVLKLDDTYLYCTMMLHISSSQKIGKHMWLNNLALFNCQFVITSANHWASTIITINLDYSYSPH